MIEFFYALIAYVANSSCTLSVLFKQRHPISINLFGSHKTIEGFLIGFNLGLLTSVLLSIDFRIGFLISLFTQFGDMIGSFIKRRLGFSSGFNLPLTDQLGFIVLVFFALSFITNLNMPLVLLIIILTYFIHRLANLIAFKLRLKDVNW